VDDQYHASVRLSRWRVKTWQASFAQLALAPDVEIVSRAFHTLPATPYAPVRRQLLHLLGQVNRRRKRANLEMIPVMALRLRRRPVAPFHGAEARLGS
jgi:hypothetical protein